MTDIRNGANSHYCEAVAPSSTANIGPGFDVFGLALDLFHDKVTVRKHESKTGKINITLSDKSNYNLRIPSNVDSNSAGLAVKKLCIESGIENDIELFILKGVPPGYGLGSSAASAAAAVMGVNHLFKIGYERKRLVEFAAEGEVASAGVRHYDNVAASLLGGFVIVRSSPRLEFTRIQPPANLILVVAIPKLPVPEKKTEVARSVLPKLVPLNKVVDNIASASMVVSGFLLNDVKMIANGIEDAIVEPARKGLIKGFDKVKEYALNDGALAVTISGAGPSIIAFGQSGNGADAYRIANSMRRGFLDSDIDANTYVCCPSNGACIISDSA
ncbi:MAG: homoserine kinase [Thermoproteota archaeon]|nr:homoserine kinase [Thermoproteota archaeon]